MARAESIRPPIGLEYTAPRRIRSTEVPGETHMATGFAVFAGTKPENIHAAAREAERLGYASFWVNHPGSTDGLAALAQAAGQTRRIELGIGVIPLHTRRPGSLVVCVKSTSVPLDTPE